MSLSGPKIDRNHHKDCPLNEGIQLLEVFLCCAESEAESAMERDNSNKHERQAQTWLFQTCV